MSNRKRTRRVVIAAAMTLLVSLGLWAWTSGIYYRPLPKLGFAIHLPFVKLGADANEEGIHLRVRKHRESHFPAIHFGGGYTSYPHGYDVNVLGLVVAVLPTAYDGGDYFVSPYAALILPYWLLILGAASVLIVRAPVFTCLAPYWRLSKLSGGLAGIVCVVFVMLNVVPSVWGPASSRPRTLSKWVTLTLRPDSTYSEVMLVYGYPFPCYRRGIINGKSVSMFHGASVGWKPHRAMENVCIAAFAICCVVLVTQRLHKHAPRRTSGCGAE